MKMKIEVKISGLRARGPKLGQAWIGVQGAKSEWVWN